MKKIVKASLCIMIFVLASVNFTFADWVMENNNYRYFNTAANQYVINNWLQTGNGFYFFDQNGYIVKGWYLINGDYYYFNNDGLMLTGFQVINDKVYYLDMGNGKMITGWVQLYENGKLTYMYFGEDGAGKIGWTQIGDQKKWYYFNDGKALVDTWAKINDVWYHFNKDASMDTGWILDNGKMYYLNLSNGGLTKGWIQDQYGNEYYLSENDGSLAINTTIMIGGISYTFNETGKCISKNQYANTSGNNYYVNGAGTNAQGAYGVNVGISPGTNTIQGISSTSAQQYQQSTLVPGSTAGPK